VDSDRCSIQSGFETVSESLPRKRSCPFLTFFLDTLSFLAHNCSIIKREMNTLFQEWLHMSVKIRLARHGSKKKPFYRVVVAESEFPRDGRFIDVLGTYDPRNKTAGIKVDGEAVRKWMAKGAEVSATVRRIIRGSAPATPEAE
jgi:small subunit ribosomal protein S16